MIRPMVEAYIDIRMEVFMRVIGSRTSRRGWGERNGQMGLFMKDSIQMD